MASTGVVTALGCHRGRGRGCRADRCSPADGLGPSSYPRARTRRRRNTRARHTHQTARGTPMARRPIQRSGCERPTRARRGRDLSVRVSELVDRGHCIVHLIVIGASTGGCAGALPITLPLRRSRVARHRVSALAHRGLRPCPGCRRGCAGVSGAGRRHAALASELSSSLPPVIPKRTGPLPGVGLAVDWRVELGSVHNPVALRMLAVLARLLG